MDVLGSVAAWFADARHWSGPDGIPVRVLEHLHVSGLALLIAAALALPAGVWLGHLGRGSFFAINVASFGRALPAFALIALALPVSIALGQGLGFFPTLLAMIPLGLPPMVTNAYVALRQVDADIVEAARGMGLAEGQVLAHVELPLALPLILDGVRSAAVAIVATATLGALVAGGGLGRYIVDGFALQDYERMIAGAVLVALVAIGIEVGFGLLTRAARHTGERAE